ncbi:Histidine biosynthesis protein [Dillenia turbinata]|uniref:Histidine biosynthesis protein n=1 Tax=Dillenia turbinata TaxID=194707 RepID=A0AAN8WE00_9MAGN
MAVRLLGSSQMMNAASSYSSSSSRMFVHRDNTDRKKVTFKSTNFSIRAHSSSLAGESVVTLLDYGAGNVRSVRNAIRHLGYDIKDVNTPEDILNANRLIFPGVGAFAPAMDVLNLNGWVPNANSLEFFSAGPLPHQFLLGEALIEYIKSDRPFLGICLGLQLLFESSEENGPVKGLGLIPGVVGRFDSSIGFRVPHIGWHALKIVKDSEILDDVGDCHVYFVHSYRAMPSDDNKEWISSVCNYGEDFIASIRRGNVHAVQFHPEKSGDVGLSVLRRFLQPTSTATRKASSQKASKLAKRVIACLDVRTNDKGDLVVTKGDQYDVREHTKENEVRNLGKPVELAQQYYKDGADEVSFLNITGFRDFPLGDLPMLQVLRYTSENVFVPLTVGGGIRDFTDANGRHYSSLEVASEYFRSGADKVSIGSDAVYAAEEYIRTGVKTGKTSLEQISRVYGNQAVVVSIDPRRVYLKNPDDVEFKTIRVTNPGPNGEEYAWYQCTVNGGREGRPIGAYELAKAVEELGAGEILLNCIDCDGENELYCFQVTCLLVPQLFSGINDFLLSGQGKGFDLDLIQLVSDAVSIPVIASSGAGAVEHFSDVFKKTNASAALAAGIFHRKEVLFSSASPQLFQFLMEFMIPIRSVKEHLLKEGVEVRMLTADYLPQDVQAEKVAAIR